MANRIERRTVSLPFFRIKYQDLTVHFVLVSLALSACTASDDSVANGPEVFANEELLVGEWNDKATCT